METITQTTDFNSIPKRKDHAFGKDIYLLGRGAESGELFWLEAPSWDCGWYWGFGYMEAYTNPKYPSKSTDITIHTHWDSNIDKKGLSYFSKTTFTESEGAQLIELFKEFYSLAEKAGKAHNTDNEVFDRINKVEIPSISSKIIDILTPEKSH